MSDDNTVSASPAVSAVRIAGDDGQGWRLGVIGKRTWTIVHGRAELAPRQVPLLEEPLYDEHRAVLLHDADVLLKRRMVDVVVDGYAYPVQGRTPVDVSVRVGGMIRRARAYGPRRVTLGSTGRLLFSMPEHVDRIPLTWESAYGAWT